MIIQLKKGLVEFVDSEESYYNLIAMTPADLKKKKIHIHTVKFIRVLF